MILNLEARSQTGGKIVYTIVKSDMNYGDLDVDFSTGRQQCLPISSFVNYRCTTYIVCAQVELDFLIDMLLLTSV